MLLSHSKISSIFISTFCLISGGILFYLADDNFEPFMVAIIFLVLGMLATAILNGGWFEYRAFLLTFSVCFFIAGLSQYYAQSLFHVQMSTKDANTFFRFLKKQPPYLSFDQLKKLVNAPLAVIVWQSIYDVFMNLGFTFGTWIGVIFNSFVMGLSAVFTVKSGKEIFGLNEYRLNRIGSLFAFCGLTWLFGALLLRDCFAVFFNVLALWGIVRCLKNTNTLNFIFACLLIVISCSAIIYIRDKSQYTIILFSLIGFFVWYFKKGIGISSIFLFSALCVALFLFYFQIESGIFDALKSSEEQREQYSGFLLRADVNQSLGYRLVVNQPLPIRIIMGIGYLFIHPVPLWGYFSWEGGEYNLIKGWQGLYMVFILPPVWVGYKRIIFGKDESLDYDHKDVFYFLLIYFLISLAIVAITSLETRHYGQFIAAAIILAAIPNQLNVKDRIDTKRATKTWFLIVISLHIVWFMLRSL